MNYKIIVILIGIVAAGLILLNYVEFKNPLKENLSEIDEKNEKVIHNPNNTKEKNENLTFKSVNLTENEKPFNFINSSSNKSKKTKNESQIFWYVLSDKALISHELKGQKNINGANYIVVEEKIYPPVEKFHYHQKAYSPDFIAQIIPNCPPKCETTITTPEYNNYVEYIDTKTNYVTIVLIPWIVSIKKNESIIYEKLERPSDDKSKYRYYWYNFTNYTYTKALYHIFYTCYLYLPGFINFSEINLSIEEDNSIENFIFTKTKDEKFVPTQSMKRRGELRFLGTENFNGKDTYHIEYMISEAIVSGKNEESGVRTFFGASGSKITALIDKDSKMLIYAKYEKEKTFECPNESSACEKMRKTIKKNKKTGEYRLLDNKEVRCKDEICEYNGRKYKYYNYSVSDNISPNEISKFEIFEINI